MRTQELGERLREVEREICMIRSLSVGNKPIAERAHRAQRQLHRLRTFLIEETAQQNCPVGRQS